MPPHCDAMDGPVVTAARRALEAGDPRTVLPFVPKDSEEEVTRTFDQVMRVRAQSSDARQLADLHFFETVVRLHRVGEGAPYTGLKPAGLDVGPFIPLAERAIEDESAEALADGLTGLVRDELSRRFARVVELKRASKGGVDAARDYVEAMLGLVVWAHGLSVCASAAAHEGHSHD